jgi:hypothetical protein
MLYDCGAVVAETPSDNGDVMLQLRIPRPDFLRLLKAVGLSPDQLPSVINHDLQDELEQRVV